MATGSLEMEFLIGFAQPALGAFPGTSCLPLPWGAGLRVPRAAGAGAGLPLARRGRRRQWWQPTPWRGALWGAVGMGWGALVRKALVCLAEERGSSSCSRGPTASPPCLLHRGWLSSPSCPICALTLGHGQPSSCWLPAPPPWCSLAHQEHLSYPRRGDGLLFQPRPLVLTQRCVAGCWWSGTLGWQQLSFPGGAGSDE